MHRRQTALALLEACGGDWQEAVAAVKAAAGVRAGRPAGPAKLTPTLCRKARQLQAKGVPISHIAEQLGISRQSVYSILQAR